MNPNLDLIISNTTDNFYSNLNFCTEQKQNSDNFSSYNFSSYNLSSDSYDSDIFEHILDNNIEYFIKEQEIKYKIFDDISSILRTTDGKIELILNIPKKSKLLSINKIKLSKKISNYIFDIFVSLNNKIILTKENLYNSKIKLDDVINNNNLNNNLINCSNNNINLHIFIQSINIISIINIYIYITYSYINYKNKFSYGICN